MIKKLREEEEKITAVTGWKWKLVERGGIQIRNLLISSNLFFKEDCGRQDCFACRDSLKPLDCCRRGVLYETSCQQCCDSSGKSKARYVGESARSIYERYGEHVEDGNKQMNDTHMMKHWNLHHGGVKTSFKVQVLGYYSSALERQVAEGVRINPKLFLIRQESQELSAVKPKKSKT